MSKFARFSVYFVVKLAVRDAVHDRIKDATLPPAPLAPQRLADAALRASDCAKLFDEMKECKMACHPALGRGSGGRGSAFAKEVGSFLHRSQARPQRLWFYAQPIKCLQQHFGLPGIGKCGHRRCHGVMG